jgi:hypothetical protein
MIDLTQEICMLKRRKKFLQEGYNCVICHYDVEETLEHLFFECLATSSRWFALGISWTDSVNIFQKLTLAREASQPFLYGTLYDCS